MSDRDEIVRVKRSDLQSLIDANAEAFSILDDIRREAENVSEEVNRAYKKLEAGPADISDIIIEDDDEDKAKDGDE